jgi:ABC-type enterochelin transport system permease subunit
MFVPVIIFGLLVGATYQMWTSVIQHRDLAVALTTVLYWLTLYLFERSWAKMLGLSVTLMVYLGGLVYLVDQWLLMRRAKMLTSGEMDHVIDAAPSTSTT